ncbi:MAG TPA: PfkB family carbohydrate kinase [Solirubrobacteraceae bacterium]|nr:PfkB family carbohydrate kinase [Solirubrobacteraceae bacterium]
MAQARGRHVIVVAGEALVDLVPGADGVLVPHPGGGPFNAARTIARLEQPVTFLGRLSDDRFGREHEALLRADGVDTGAVVTTAEPTTLALAELDAAGAAGYRFYAAGTAAVGLRPEAALAALPAGVVALHVGSLGLALEPLAQAVEATVDALRDHALVVADLNCRPAAAPDPAAYRARLRRVAARAHVVKASDDDLAWLDPGAPPARTARALLGAGATLVLLTRGAAGATALPAGGGAVDVPAPAAAVVDTIGAGDAFGGAFVAWWCERRLGRPDLRDEGAVTEAVAFACRVAARTCERPGAAPPRLAELRGG